MTYIPPNNRCIRKSSNHRATGGKTITFAGGCIKHLINTPSMAESRNTHLEEIA